MATKTERFVVISDTHGDNLDPAAFAAARSFIDEFKPVHRIHAGDVFDLRWLRAKASDTEKKESTVADLQAGYDLIDWFQPTVVLWGNHDARLQRALEETSGVVLDAVKSIVNEVADSLPRGCVTYPYDKRKGVHQLADWRIIHGYSHGETALRLAAGAYGNVMMGHVHRSERVKVNGIEDRIGLGIGCLCKLDLAYNATSLNTLKQSHGFAYGFIVDGRAVVFQAAPTDRGVWILPTEFRTMGVSDGQGKNSGR